jgi:hypothetical protein
LTIVRKALIVTALACSIIVFRVYVVRYGSPFDSIPSLEPGASVPHMDHTPRHGGLVLMKGDTHVEVVLTGDGRCAAYFSDAVRMEFPASYASEFTIGLASLKNGRQDALLEIDEAGKAWVGRLHMIDDPQAIVRITYVARGEAPYWIDVPLSAWRAISSGAAASWSAIR